ncbi:MAG: CDP-alcohol phosphatidyltransferase family protein [Candidatus Abyssobacteria bacterium SURF_17]|uniref:CDP-alcohol phosphatidyltransferase family protein n=1 Tax=Candidatus Abyssobacteria bacterium SURF_17 TaxID=2093361 RepID=A0A419F9G0_9BACT|nr:MAG: CDP-alcohol phosphatidyltransferase family protein [Candidatus Abyssubacteria bacterium SURF_17]
MLSKKLNHRLDKPLSPFVRQLARSGITPNMLTVGGVVMNCIAGATLLYGFLRVGGILVIAGGLFDLLDGALARVVGKESRFGSVLDSTLDRYSDIIPILGLLLHYSGWRYSEEPRLGEAALCGIVILGTLLVPYVRARAETVIEKCDVGLAERAERVIIFAGGLIVGAEVAVLWILALLTHLTVIHRLFYTRSQLAEKRGAPAASATEKNEGLTPSDAETE